MPIQYGTYPKYGASINAMELRAIKVDDDDFGLITYDPAFKNTGSTKSAITLVQGERQTRRGTVARGSRTDCPPRRTPVG